MAWIESHQTLREHPKLHRLARLLDVPRTSAAGHLHFLWWWALDHAESGTISHFDALDIALAAGWEGDPDVFMDALVDCGPGGKPGFVERTESGIYLHDWNDYAGKLIDRRVRDRERKKAQRESSVARPTDVPRTSKGVPGVQNRTETNQKTRPAKLDPDPAEFVEFWSVYPRREAKGQARKAWATAVRKVDPATILAGAKRYRDLPGREAAFTKLPATWLNGECWGDEAPVSSVVPIRKTNPW